MCSMQGNFYKNAHLLCCTNVLPCCTLRYLPVSVLLEMFYALLLSFTMCVLRQLLGYESATRLSSNKP